MGTATERGEAQAAGMTTSSTGSGCLEGEGEGGTGISLRLLLTDGCLRDRRTLGEERGRREGERCGDREGWRGRGRV